jgi:hypothetical protein
VRSWGLTADKWGFRRLPKAPAKAPLRQKTKIIQYKFNGWPDLGHTITVGIAFYMLTHIDALVHQYLGFTTGQMQF